MPMPDPSRPPSPAPATGQEGTESGGPSRPAARSGLRLVGLVALATLAGALAAALALYGMNRLPGNGQTVQTTAAPDASPLPATGPEAGLCGDAPARAAALAPLVKGQMGALQLASSGRALPPLSFTGPDGKPLTLQDFKGRTILINLWATWCAPCREEMPALDRLQAALGSERFEVVTINLDTRDPQKPRTFFDEVGVRHLKLYTDPQKASFQALRGVGRGFGLPSTLLVNGNGCEIAFLAGPAEWDSQAAQQLVRAVMDMDCAPATPPPAGSDKNL